MLATLWVERVDSHTQEIKPIVTYSCETSD